MRQGLEKYDRRKGWRGVLKNKVYTDKWAEDLKEFNLEKSIGWNIAIIKEINKFSVNIETQNKLKGKINYKDITWTKKEFSDLFQIGDVIYVKRFMKIIIL